MKIHPLVLDALIAEKKAEFANAEVAMKRAIITHYERLSSLNTDLQHLKYERSREEYQI